MCKKNFVPHHREIGAISCNFKRINTILNSEILLNLIRKMKYVTEKLCFVLHYIRNMIGIFADHLLHMLRLVLALWYLKVHDDIDIDALVTELKPLKNISLSSYLMLSKLYVVSAKLSYPCSYAQASEGFFSRGEGISGFFHR